MIPSFGTSGGRFFPGQRPHRFRIFLVAGASLLLAAGLLAGFFAWRRHQPQRPSFPEIADPRLVYAGPYRNIDPAVNYVGDAACSDCHVEKTRSYRRHSMGRSLFPIRDVIEQLPPHGKEHSFSAFNSRLSVETQGRQMWHHQTRLDAAGQPIYAHDLEVQYVIGSGTRGFSYLMDRDGFLFQSPISWFTQKQTWDLSPGFPRTWLNGRPIGAECLFCHANRVRPREGTVNGYEPPIFDGHTIGCERCHGPGERHVRDRANQAAFEGPIDFTIVNPRKGSGIEPARRDAICEQCHLAGEARLPRRGRGLFDFRPGLPFEMFWSVFVRDRSAEPSAKAVNHVEQMHLSRCYQQSADDTKLGCISCHDPHETVPPSKRVSYYRGKCLECHQEHGCSLPREVRLQKSKQDSCIDCHMPRYPSSNIPHTAATDHRIPRRAETPSPEQRHDQPLRAIVPFYPPDNAAEERELLRDRGIALSRLGLSGKRDMQHFLPQAVEPLHDFLAQCPDDVPALEAYGQVLTVLGQDAEAKTAFESLLRLSPRQEVAARSLARMAQKNGDVETALTYWRRAVDINPQAADYHGNLATLLAGKGEWADARRHCQSWLHLDPESVEARKLWVRCLRQQGDTKGAREEMERLLRLRE